MSKKLKAQYTSEDKCVGDIKRKFIKHPDFQSRVRTSAALTVGNALLGFYRGQQAGIHDAYRTIRKKFPKAAQALIDAYGMSKSGDLGM